MKVFVVYSSNRYRYAELGSGFLILGIFTIEEKAKAAVAEAKKDNEDSGREIDYVERNLDDEDLWW